MIEPDHCAEAVGRSSASAQGRDSVLGGHLVCAASLNAGAMAWLTLWASNSPCHRGGAKVECYRLGCFVCVPGDRCGDVQACRMVWAEETGRQNHDSGRG